jgi:hypothetical protein
MKEKRKKSWKQRVVSILICLGVCWLIYAGAMNWMVWHFARETSRYRQNLGVVPTALRETRIEELRGPRIDKFGTSFRVPWSDIEHETNAKSATVLTFKEGAGLFIFDPTDQVDGAKTMRGTTTRQLRLMTNIFGSQALQSNYELMAAEVQALPADVKWWVGRSRNIRSFILLTYKSSDLLDATAIHEIHSSVVRGFQFGEPNVPPYRVGLDLFDETDHHYRIWITGKDKSKPCITQAQINGLVASFRGLPSGAVDSAPANGD